MKIKFLGTNGWYSTKTGNTVCTLVLTVGKAIVLDAGEGFCKVADELRKAGIKKADIFISHLHLDHCAGLHMLAKLGRDVEAKIFVEERYCEKLKLLLDSPFTASLDNPLMKAKVTIVPFRAGERMEYFLPLALPHSDPSAGFRFEIEGKKIAYCLDAGPCENMRKLAEGADAFVTECSFMPGTPINPEWQHMTPELAAKQALEAHSKMLVLTHFGANEYAKLDDRKKAGAAAKKIFKNTVIAYDGEALEV